tara:strand:- start:1950 stop:2183 length:234 start_codon:yes stop_codon:yes gene_type:complete
VKTRFDKALANAYDGENSHDNINKAIEIARNLKIIDILEPSSKTIGEIAEILSRLKSADKLEIIDLQDFTGNINTYS